MIRLQWKGVVERRASVGRMLTEAGDAALVRRGRPRLLVIKCPCGCGEELPINLDDRAGPAWRLYDEPLGHSLFPSVWRDSGCGSHFIIWDDRILLFHDPRAYGSDEFWGDASVVIADGIIDAIPEDKRVSFSDLADTLRAVPWRVLVACRALVARGLLFEGDGDERGTFGRLR